MPDEPRSETWPTDPTPPPPERPAPTPPVAPEPEDGHGIGGFLRELPVLVVIAFGLALIIKTFLAQAFFIPSESMLPTLQVDDRVLVNKLVYRFREPHRGEIIVFVAERDERARSFWQKVRGLFTEGFGVQSSERDLIKRVIGLPGETVEVDARGRTFITPAAGGDRFRLREPYVTELEPEPYGPVVVPDDTYIVFGDNRPNSSDARKGLAPVPRADIIGKAFMRIWPPGRIGFFRTPDYQARAVRAPPVSSGAWSQTAASSPSCATPVSAWSPAWTRPAAALWPARWSPARSSSPTTPICPA